MPVLIRPPEAAHPRDIAYYVERLADPSLVRRSVAVEADGAHYLAVPVGGTRLGGYIPVASILTGIDIRDALTGRSGYPDPRLRWSDDPLCCHTVAWGPTAPEGHVPAGRFYGYSERAVSRQHHTAQLAIPP